MIRCLPVDIIERHPKARCKGGEWKLKLRIGEESAYGQVWQACCKTNCNYVMKHISFEAAPRGEFGYTPQTKEEFINEVRMQKKAAEAKLALPIVDSWTCKGGGIMIMRALKQTARNLLLSYPNNVVRSKILGTVVGLILKLHSIGMYHGDTHLNNFMVTFDMGDRQEAEEDYVVYKDSGEIDEDKTDWEKLYIDTNYRFYFIDMGASGFLPEDEEKKREFIKEDFRGITMDLHNLVDSGNTSFTSLSEFFISLMQLFQ